MAGLIILFCLSGYSLYINLPINNDDRIEQPGSTTSGYTWLQKLLLGKNWEEAVPFRISSMNSGFSMVGTFDGRYRVYPDFIEVTVTKATIYLLDNAPYKGRRELTSVTFGLGSDIPQGWNIVNQAQVLPVNKVMKLGDTYTFNNAHFLIPKEGLTKLSQHWLIVQMESITLEPRPSGSGFSYAHSLRTIFR